MGPVIEVHDRVGKLKPQHSGWRVGKKVPRESERTREVAETERPAHKDVYDVKLHIGGPDPNPHTN